MILSNQVYNGDFLLAQANKSDFPDGWDKLGGGSHTRWEWLGPKPGPRSLCILHPSGPKAAIIQAAETQIQAGEGQRWEVKAILQTNPAHVICYLKVYLGAVSQLVFTLQPEAKPQVFSRVFATPPGTTGLRFEVGIMGEGDLVIHEMQGYRLYPYQTLRLDQKGQIYVNHIDSLGQIEKPVLVKIMGPVPIPVNVNTTVISDIRELTPLRDGVKIYSQDGSGISATSEGFLQVEAASCRFQETSQNLTANPLPAATLPWDVAIWKVYTICVSNDGPAPAYIRLELSPDGLSWQEDAPAAELLPDRMLLLTPHYFLRFTRLTYWAAAATQLKIWVQAQT